MPARHKFTHEQIEELEQAYKSSKSKLAEKHLRAVLLYAQGKPYAEICETTGYSEINISSMSPFSTLLTLLTRYFSTNTGTSGSLPQISTSGIPLQIFSAAGLSWNLFLAEVKRYFLHAIMNTSWILSSRESRVKTTRLSPST